MTYIKREKQDLPLLNDCEITRLVDNFEACGLPYANWTHRAHLAVALYYSRKWPFEDALVRIRDNINRYNKTCGDPSGYNETITLLFLRKIYAQKNLQKNIGSLAAELACLERLCTINWLYNYYSPDLIWSDLAKTSWAEPDIAPIDF